MATTPCVSATTGIIPRNWNACAHPLVMDVNAATMGAATVVLPDAALANVASKRLVSVNVSRTVAGANAVWTKSAERWNAGVAVLVKCATTARECARCLEA